MNIIPNIPNIPLTAATVAPRIPATPCRFILCISAAKAWRVSSGGSGMPSASRKQVASC